MLDMKIIDEEIEKLEETSRTTMNICQQLAVLYTVREHFKGNRSKVSQNPSINSMPSVLG